MTSAGLEAVFLANRAPLLRFLTAHGAGDAAEDVLQELWIKVSSTPSGPISAPLPYLYRAANNLMIDRHRARRQAAERDHAWAEVTGLAAGEASDEPSGEQRMIAREALSIVQSVLAELTPRAADVFRRHRIDGLPQKVIAAELGVSISTIESDLRQAYRALIDARRRIDEA